MCGEIKEVLPEENVFEGVFKYIYKNRCNKNEWDIDENKYDTGGNISNTELENTLDKRYSSNSNLKNISYDLEISENLLESLSADLSEDLLKIRKNTFLEKEIGKAFLVVAATSNREENHHIAELCHAYNVLVNVADSEEESSFIFPSVVRKGDISIGINSGTGSPTVSKHIRKQIEKAVPDYYADIAVFMGKLREYVKANFKEESQRRYILKTAAAEAFAEERVLTQKEIEEIIKEMQNEEKPRGIETSFFSNVFNKIQCCLNSARKQIISDVKITTSGTVEPFGRIYKWLSRVGWPPQHDIHTQPLFGLIRGDEIEKPGLKIVSKFIFGLHFFQRFCIGNPFFCIFFLLRSRKNLGQRQEQPANRFAKAVNGIPLKFEIEIPYHLG